MTNFTYHEMISLKNRYTCGCGSVLQKCSLIAHMKTEKHMNYAREKQSQFQLLKASIDKLTYEKMIIMQGIIDNFTVIERYVLKQLKRKDMDSDYETCQEYKKSRKK